MFKLIKQLLGYPTEAEKAAAKVQAEAPYKVEPPTVQEAAPAPQPEIKAETAPAEKPAKAKKKPASKKPAGEKKETAKKSGRKPKSAKV